MTDTPNQHLSELKKTERTTTGFGAGSYGSDLQSAFVDPVSGQQVSGMGFVPLANGSTATIGELILGARQPKNLAKIRSALIKNGLIGKTVKSIGSVQTAWQQVVIGASTAQIDPYDYMKQLRSGGFGQDTAEANLPNREIYKKTEADRIAMLNQVSQTLRGQDITEQDKSQQWYKELKASVDKMIDTGSVRTVTKQVNPKTKKLESVATTVPGYSEEQVAATAEKAIRKATPQDVSRKERVDFTSWMFSTLGGKNG